MNLVNLASPFAEYFVSTANTGRSIAPTPASATHTASRNKNPGKDIPKSIAKGDATAPSAPPIIIAAPLNATEAKVITTDRKTAQRGIMRRVIKKNIPIISPIDTPMARPPFLTVFLFCSDF